MRIAVVQLGGKSYEIKELRARQNEGFRKKVKAELAPVATLLATAPDTELNMKTIGGIAAQLQDVLFGSIETVRRLVADYSPEIAADITHVAEEAYDSELVAAFVAVVKLAFPLGQMIPTPPKSPGPTPPPTMPS
jgi:hypothetical protein